MRRLTLAFGLVLSAIAVNPAAAQTPRALAVERAIPFGTATGRILLIGNHLVYVDDVKVDSSFAVLRSEVSNVMADAANITVQFREAMKDGSGSSTRAVFRALTPSDSSLVTAWFNTASPAGTGTSAAPGAPAAATSPSSETFEARHNHLRGSCKGRLIVSPTQLSYESVDDVSHSRRWDYESIKEIKQDNPYEIEVKPFTGGSYKLYLDGSGMMPATFKTLVDRVTSARSAK